MQVRPFRLFGRLPGVVYMAPVERGGCDKCVGLGTNYVVAHCKDTQPQFRVEWMQ